IPGWACPSLFSGLQAGMRGALAIVIAITAGWPAFAAEDQEAQRLEYLEHALDGSRNSVRLWQEGWTTVYGMAAIAYAGMALDTEDSDEKVLNGLGSARALLAATLLTLRPHPGRDGADPVRALGDAPLHQRLDAAEHLLRDSVRRTESKRRPGRHLRNILINLGFGGLVWALGDKDDALPFTLMGIAGGEAVLLTLPEQPRRDLREYRSRYGTRGNDKRAWTLVPQPGGIALQFALER
ncbi:MAG: hypothetical protein PVI08_06950, partial [Gammaproteobacteria bacterium]